MSTAQPAAASPSPMATVQTPQAQTTVRNNSFTPQDLDNAWLTIPKEVGGDDRQRATLMNASVHLDGTAVIISVDNVLQEESLQELKPTIQRTLANRLQNDNIALKVVVVESNHAEHGSPKERYQYLLSLNPQLDNLRSALNLELQ